MTGAPESGSPVSHRASWVMARGRRLDLISTRVMGIVNVTPDSFSDGGSFMDHGRAIDHGLAMIDQGADILDIGGESTRPGAEEISVLEERKRVIPVVAGISKQAQVPLSIDTTKAEVAAEALEAGAVVINDVSGLHGDPEMARLAARSGAGLVLMHMRGCPRTMKDRARYVDLVGEVISELEASVHVALEAGAAPETIVLDPGIGFAKDARQSLVLLRYLSEVRALGYPVLVGPSRKSFIGAVTGAPVDRRVPGTISSAVSAALSGARVIRVHDVEEAVQALRVADAIRTAGDE